MLENKLLPILIFGLGVGFLGRSYERIPSNKTNNYSDVVVPNVISVDYNLREKELKKDER